MKKVWYRKQSSRFPDINASPGRPAFFSSEFEYMDLFGDDMQQPRVFVVFLDENLPVFDVWKDSVEELCDYPAPCVKFLLGDALETMTHCLDKFLEMIGDRPDAKAIRLALKKLDERYAPMADVAEAADAELLEFAEWAAKIVERAKAEHVHPYQVVISDMIQAKPGIKGIIDGPGSLMSIDPNIQSSVAYTLSMREVNWLLEHKADDMESGDPARVKAAVEACRRSDRLYEDIGKPPVTDIGRVLRLDSEITAGNTKPRPFKMVKTGGNKTISEQDRQIHYWAHMLDEVRAGG